MPLNAETNVLIFNFDHFYPGSGEYRISFVGENRVRGVANMGFSDQQTFYISSSNHHQPGLRAQPLAGAARPGH